MRSVRLFRRLVGSTSCVSDGLQVLQVSAHVAPALPCTARTLSWHPTSTGATNTSAQSRYSGVVVTGAGPVGLTTSLLLQKYGVPTVVLEQNSQLTNHPQAHYINHRTMEIFRGLDGLAEEVEAMMPPLSQWRQFIYCTYLLGDVLGSVDHFKGQLTPRSSMLSPEPVAHLPQHRLLPLLVQKAAEHHDDIQLQMGVQVTRVVPTSDGQAISVTVKPETGEEYTLVAKYLVAADGAHSSIRRSVGVRMVGPGTIQHLVNIHFISLNLGKALMRENRKGMLYFVFNKDVIAVIVAHDLERGEFVAQVPYFPPLQSPKEFTIGVCEDLIQKFAGVKVADVQVKTIRPWAMSAAIAERYSAHNGRVFFVGDAAHVVPPAGAFGMNTGIQDAHNLAWKLALSMNGASGKQLLNTYEYERKPIAEANMRLSVQNFHETLEVARVMGLDYNLANNISNTLSSQSLEWFPTQLRRRALMTIFNTGRVAGSALGYLRKSRLKQLFEAGETLRLQYPKEDLGFVYGSRNAAIGATLSHPNAIKKSMSMDLPKNRDAPYLPSLVPGGRLPHVPLLVERAGSLPGVQCGDEISSIDLSAIRGIGFTLLLSGINMQGLFDWITASNLWQERQDYGVALGLVVISETADLAKQLALNMPPSSSLDNVAFVVDTSGSWKDVIVPFCEIEGLAVLVRPDGHIAWLHEFFPGRGVDDKATTLGNVLRHVLKVSD
jgi:2-polyprenyl-6-methoxyphenol hydroxylase-like FAD-dependent oxidoreductase